MNTDNASLVNKLILLVLSLILVCLVLIVVRAYTERTLGKPREAAVAQAGCTVDEPAEVGVEPSPPTADSPRSDEPGPFHCPRSPIASGEPG